MVLQKMCVSQNLSQIPGVLSSHIFYGGPSRSLNFFFNAKEVTGSQKIYQPRRLAESRIYHSTPLVSHPGGVEILLVTLCYGNHAKLQPDGQLGSYVYIRPGESTVVLKRTVNYNNF